MTQQVVAIVFTEVSGQPTVHMRPIGCPETSVRNPSYYYHHHYYYCCCYYYYYYYYSLRNYPEDRSSHLQDNS